MFKILLSFLLLAFLSYWSFASIRDIIKKVKEHRTRKCGNDSVKEDDVHYTKNL